MNREPKAQSQSPESRLALTRRTVSILSPLRFPGSKRRLAVFIQRALEENEIVPKLFVEPFAGGASVALQLLKNGAVERIGLADRDSLVAAFWKTVFFDADWLVDEIRSIEISLQQWDRFKKSRPKDRRERALACLFLNRTSFSGILARGAGPIGGRSQESAFTLDCRFPRETLVRRIRQAESLRDHIDFVWNLPWAGTISLLRRMQKRGGLSEGLFFYFDPPFFEKANRLYRHWFSDAEHRRFRDSVMALREKWVLSYDSVPRSRALYSNASPNGARIESLYSASSKGGMRRAEEAIITNLPRLPIERRLWRASAEW